MAFEFSDADFRRANERCYLRSVRDAAEETYWATAWRPSAEGVRVLPESLEKRGITPDTEAVRRGAALISRGRRPLIMQPMVWEPGNGRHRN